VKTPSLGHEGEQVLLAHVRKEESIRAKILYLFILQLSTSDSGVAVTAADELEARADGGGAARERGGGVDPPPGGRGAQALHGAKG
jgi:hypothetical protein